MRIVPQRERIMGPPYVEGRNDGLNNQEAYSVKGGLIVAKHKIITPDDEARAAKCYPEVYREEAAKVRASIAGLTGRLYLLTLGYMEAAVYDSKRGDIYFADIRKVARADYISELMRLVSDKEWLTGATDRGARLYHEAIELRLT